MSYLTSPFLGFLICEMNLVTIKLIINTNLKGSLEALNLLIYVKYLKVCPPSIWCILCKYSNCIAVYHIDGRFQTGNHRLDLSCNHAGFSLALLLYTICFSVLPTCEGGYFTLTPVSWVFLGNHGRLG